ncbi:MAG: ATP-binding cassette domain-containing protein [Leptolyngbya sp. SIO3F4]|nr:ATP-binding cassette domain-containing protein [Leptolyngbya sp. SIO3F4]
MIETINLTKKYGELIALNNLNLTIDEGDCFGFIGPNGAGKTTTIKILATLLKPTWGEARIDGKVVGYQNPQIRPHLAESGHPDQRDFLQHQRQYGPRWECWANQ